MRFANKLKIFFIKYLVVKSARKRLLFEHHFFVNRYFLHASACDQHMAHILNILVEDLNLFIEANYGIEFNQLLELHRFKHFWSEFTNPLNSNLPIQSIISSCGFNSMDQFNSLITGHMEESKDILKKNFS